MIKGAGGALWKEKITAQSSGEMIVIVDETKLVTHLGKHPVPVEISPFLYLSTINRLSAAYSSCTLRIDRNQQLYVTDSGNYIVDIQFGFPIHDPAKEHYALKSILGVVETGLFFDIRAKVVVGRSDGTTQTL